jgi:hypothetical protein
MNWLGRLLCWFDKHLPPPKNPRGHGAWVCARRGCGQIVSRDWPAPASLRTSGRVRR